MEETDLEAKARRASILKLKSKSPGGPSLDVTLATKRRVSFSSRNRVKPFAADQDENTIWDNTYEEQADQTDSTRSSTDTVSNYPDKAKNQPEFQIWENLDTTVRGNMEMEFTCSAMKQETILNQSVMDFTIIPPPPENPEIITHYMTMNQSCTMELTCQKADEMQGDMQASMNITKGLSEVNNEYCKNKTLKEIPKQREINPEDTICNSVTMELTGIIPSLSDAAFVVPNIIPQRDVILRDTAFNESATMDFTKTMTFISQTAQSEKPSAFEHNVNDGIQIQPKTSLFTHYSQKTSTEGSQKVVQANAPALNNTGFDITIPSAQFSFSHEPDSQLCEPKKGVNKISNASSDGMDMTLCVSKNICLKGQEESHANSHASDSLSDKLYFSQEPNNQLQKPKKGILVKKTIPESTSDMKIQESVQCQSSSEGGNKLPNASSNEIDSSVHASMSLKGASNPLSDKLPTCQEPRSRQRKLNTLSFCNVTSDITIPSAKFSFCEDPDGELGKPKKGVSVKKTIPESEIKASSDKMDMSACVSRNMSGRDQADSFANKHASDSLSDKLGSTYTIAKKLSLGKTFVIESNNCSDKENIHPVLSVEMDESAKILQVKPPITCDKKNINPLLVATVNVDEKENIKPTCLAVADEEQHEITTGIDKENKKPLMRPLENTDDLKYMLPTNYGSNNLDVQKPPKEPHVSQEDIQSTEKANALSFTSDGDISGLLQNDLSAEMFMPSQQLNEDNAYNPSNVLYSEKIKPPELSSPEEASALITTTSFAYNNSELDTDQLIHATFSQPDEISRGEFSIHCQDVLKKISSYLPPRRTPINFDRRERNERTRRLVEHYEKMRKEMHEILSNFKLPVFKWESVRVDTEVSTLESDASSTNQTNEEDENEIVVVRKTVLEKVQEAVERVKEGRWVFLGNKECYYYFTALFRSIFMKVTIDPNSGIVKTYETDFNDAFDTTELEPIFHYHAAVLNLKLKKDHVSSMLGEKYDLLTFLDFVHMSADEILLFNGLWVHMEIKFRKSHKIRMTKDYKMIVEVLNAKHVIWWIISLKLSVSTVPGQCEEVTAKAHLGEPVNEECIKKLASSIPPGPQYIYKFMLKLIEFTEKLVHRLNYEKKAIGFK